MTRTSSSVSADRRRNVFRSPRELGSKVGVAARVRPVAREMEDELGNGCVVEHLVDLGDQADVEIKPGVAEQAPGQHDRRAVVARLEPPWTLEVGVDVLRAQHNLTV